jgi:hypothetical protein
VSENTQKVNYQDIDCKECPKPEHQGRKTVRPLTRGKDFAPTVRPIHGPTATENGKRRLTSPDGIRQLLNTAARSNSQTEGRQMGRGLNSVRPASSRRAFGSVGELKTRRRQMSGFHPMSVSHQLTRYARQHEASVLIPTGCANAMSSSIHLLHARSPAPKLPEP